MKLPLTNSSFNFLRGLTIFVICGFDTTTTAAHPLSTLLTTITSSAPFDLRAANFEKSDGLSTISPKVAKRDFSFSFVHAAFVVVILTLVVGVMIWCKCKNRKNSQAKDMGDGDSKMGMGGMCVMM